MAWSEASLHRWLLARARRRQAARDAAPPGGRRSLLVGGPGDDVACLRASTERTVLCVDHTVEGVHVPAGTAPAITGRKAADRALSDLAASAATPRALLLALAAPRDAEEAHLRALIAAVDRRGRRFGAPLVGGDLTSAPGCCVLSVTAVGGLPARLPVPARDRARPGDVLLLSGPVGGSGLGRRLAIQPRLSAARWLLERGAHALMDTTDGLALDLERFAAASGVRFELEAVPLHRDARRAAAASGRTPLEHGLEDGEDHELIVSLPAPRLAAVLAGLARHAPGLVVLGRVRAGRGVWLVEDAGPRRLEARGWDHGRS